MSHAASAASPFQVRLEPSGRSYPLDDAETVLAGGIRHGINLPYGCKDGACGSCKCQKLSGQVRHGPHQSKALSEDEEAQGWVLTCCASALSDLVLQVQQVGSQGMFACKKVPTRVSLLERKSPDVMRLLLQLPASEPLQYHAGQYIDFLLPGGQRRSYSMACAPHRVREGLELHVRHMPGGLFTDLVFGAMKERDILRIEGPFGSFYLRDSAKPIILLASGTGFAPAKALLEHLQFTGSQRQVALYWGGRRPSDLYMDDWVQQLLPALPTLRYVPVVSDALEQDHWHGRTGLVHLALLQDQPDLHMHQVYACGAPAMVEAARRDFLAAGLPADEFFADAFTSAADKLAAPT